jgi:hypothetical protein
MKRLLLPLFAIFLTAQAYAWTIKESKQDEDFKVIVNDGGSFKEALTVVGSTGQVKVGADGFDVTAGGTATLTTTGLINPSFTALTTTQASYSATSNLVRSGTYTPTAVEILNLDSNPTAIGSSMMWTQIGRIVYCSGYIAVDPTTISTATAFTLTVPVLPTSNFGSSLEAAGSGSVLSSGLGSSGAPVYISASGSAKTVDVGFFAPDATAGRNLIYHFQYTVN